MTRNDFWRSASIGCLVGFVSVIVVIESAMRSPELGLTLCVLGIAVALARLWHGSRVQKVTAATVLSWFAFGFCICTLELRERGIRSVPVESILHFYYLKPIGQLAHGNQAQIIPPEILDVASQAFAGRRTFMFRHSGWEWPKNAQIEQAGRELKLSFQVPHEIDPERTRELAESFLRIVKAYNGQESQPAEVIGTGVFDYEVLVSDLSGEPLARGSKPAGQDVIAWRSLGAGANQAPGK